MAIIFFRRVAYIFLKICHEPIWDKRKKLWYYYYRYGYEEHEYGCADEIQLLKCAAVNIR